MSQISHYLNLAFHCYYIFFFVFDLYPCSKIWPYADLFGNIIKITLMGYETWNCFKKNLSNLHLHCLIMWPHAKTWPFICLCANLLVTLLLWNKKSYYKSAGTLQIGIFRNTTENTAKTTLHPKLEAPRSLYSSPGYNNNMS
jgi:hypothetical protein